MADMRSGDNWEVKVVGYEGMGLSQNATPTGTPQPVDIEGLLDSLAIFADKAGDKLNRMDICPSELSVKGNVTLDIGGALVFGVSVGIEVSMTWKFDETFSSTSPRGGKRSIAPNPPTPPSPKS